MEENIIEKNVIGKVGPKAPKDPVKRRSGFYVMFESVIEATERNDGKPSQDVYLEGEQLINKVKLSGGVTDDEILNLLKNSEGFHKLVHSIGVWVKASDSYSGNINFVLENWGKTDKYVTGTHLRVPCPKDGTEMTLKLDDFEWSPDDYTLGRFAIEFDNVGEMATASIKIYLNDGYEVPEIEIEPPVEYGTETYQKMIAKSLLNKGNNKRLKAAIEKAERGEKVTIACIGGSITQGAGAKPIHSNCYAYKSYLIFREMFGKDGGDNIYFVKAGVGGTPSELGIIRYERDVLRDGSIDPDVVIIEFAVNDEGDETKGNCYESLVLKALSGKNEPAVILLFSVFLNDWNLQDRLSPVGRHYDLPMVSVKDAVVEQFKLAKAEGNIISKRQFFYDIYHPTNDGHTVMADCLGYLFSETRKSPKDVEDIVIEKAPIIGNYFREIHLLDKKDNVEIATIDVGSFTETDTDLQMVEMDHDPFPSPEFPYNWVRSVSSGNDSFKMTITSSGLILVFKDSGNIEVGKADIFVDGKYVKTVDPHENGWTHCNAVILYQDESSREHFVEIRMAPDCQDKGFTILGFGYIS